MRVLEGGTNGSLAVFRVTLANPPSDGRVLVDVATVGLTGSDAAGAEDYVPLTQTLTFLPGQTEQSVAVRILGDTLAEGEETFQVKLTNARLADARGITPLAGAIGDDTGVGTIVDGTSLFSVENATITEGDSGTSTANFIVRLLSSQPETVTVVARTISGSAAGDGTNPDYNTTSQTLTFTSGQTQQIFKVPVRGDLIREQTETFRVLLETSAFGETTLVATAIGTIEDNNDPVPTVSIGDARVAEGNSGTTAMVFTATLSQPSDTAVTVNFSTQDGTGPRAAFRGADYLQTSGTATFQPGQTTTTISVPILGDVTDEFDETFSLTLNSPTNATLARATATGTILNDESVVSISGPVSVTEGQSGTKNVIFNVSLNTPSAVHPVTVNFTTLDGTATSSGTMADFVAKSGSLTFGAGSSGTQPITIVVNGDSRAELDETFFVRLTSATNAVLATGADTAMTTILNDDGSPVISVSSVQILEGDSGTKALTFTVSLDKPSDVAITVRASTENGSALAGEDFTALNNQLITFAPGETSQTVAVQVLGDTIDESDEGFSLVLSQPSTGAMVSPSAGTASGTILDDDQPTISVSGMSIVEGDSGTRELTFTVNLSRDATREVRVNFSTLNDTALAGQDYLATSGTLVFEPSIPDDPDTEGDQSLPGETTKTVTVTVIGDTAVEGNERFFLQLSDAVNGKLTTNPRAAGVLIDDEATVRLSPVGGLTVAEDGGSVAEFRVIRGGDLSNAVSVQFETVDGTARSTGARADFTAQSGRITFAAGSNVASDTIRVPIIGDSNFENDETFEVRLFNPVNAAVLAGGEAALEGSATVTILDNDVAPVLRIDSARIMEGNLVTQATPTQQVGDRVRSTLTFTVTLSAANERSGPVTVDYQFTDGEGPNGARKAASADGFLLQDYIGIGGTLTFAAGETQKTINVTVLGDARDEVAEEVFYVDLSNARRGGVADPNGIAVSRGIGTIVDDDAAPTLFFAGTNSGNTSFTEGNSGTTPGAFRLELSAVSERPVSVRVTTEDGTATSTGPRPDFTALNQVLATYTPGDPTKQFTFSVPIIGDVADEANETFTVRLSNPQFAQIADSVAIGTITDDDAAPGITVNDVSIQEGNSGRQNMVFTISLFTASDQTVRVNYATAPGTAVSTGSLRDFIAKSGTLVFAPGETTKEVRVPIIGDTNKEASAGETFTLNLSTPVNATILTASGTGTILDDGDTAVGISIGDAFVAEGDLGSRTLNFQVELTSTLPSDTTFKIVTRNGTAVRGTDYGGINGATFTIPANTRTMNVPVQVFGDTSFEATESVFAELRQVSGGVKIVDRTGRGTIYNDDVQQLGSRAIRFIDVDGDLATVRVSKGTLSLSNLFFVDNNGDGVPDTNAIGGRQLRAISFINDGAEFQDTNLTVKGTRQKGFNGDPQGVRGDGRVNVGFIQAAVAQPEILQFTRGIDLGVVTIDGDLGKIVVGDIFATPAIKRLSVHSLGLLGTSTQGSAAGSDTTSLVLGPVSDLTVATVLAGSFRVVGSQFGSIDHLSIGELRGGSAIGSGQLFFTGKLQDAFIGKVVGGTGDSSGVVLGSSSVPSVIAGLRIGNVLQGGSGSASGQISATKIKALEIGRIQGGAGEQSALVVGTTISNVLVNGNVIGGSGDSSGEIFSASKIGIVTINGQLRGGSGEESGSVVAQAGLDRLTISGGILGGTDDGAGSVRVGTRLGVATVNGLTGAAGDNSGSIRVGGAIGRVTILGNILGGVGNGSGGIQAGGELENGLVTGSVIGGNSSTSTRLTGYIEAQSISSLTVNGDLRAGIETAGNLILSGTIRADDTIRALRINGSVLGNEKNNATIAAGGSTDDPQAINRLQIGGDARFAEILAGYGTVAAVGNERGNPINADARIGSVKIGGNIASTSVIAGAFAGEDDVFGTADDRVIAGTGVLDSANVTSRIAKIVVGGFVESGTSPAGILAQAVKTVRIHGVTVSLNSGAGNDLSRDREVAPGSGIRIFEFPVVA